jgi:ribonuclease HIII
MGEGTILRAAAAIRRACPHAVVSLSPPEYNARHEKEGNVALFLSTMHADAIARAVADAPACDRVVIDQFTFVARLEEALVRAGVDLPVEIRPRAEDNPAVAAASVLARAEFVLGLKELGNEFGIELPRGAGAPVERTARRLFRDAGMPALAQVAKTHFKTTRRITEQLF